MRQVTQATEEACLSWHWRGEEKGLGHVFRPKQQPQQAPNRKGRKGWKNNKQNALSTRGNFGGCDKIAVRTPHTNVD